MGTGYGITGGSRSDFVPFFGRTRCQKSLPRCPPVVDHWTYQKNRREFSSYLAKIKLFLLRNDCIGKLLAEKSGENCPTFFLFQFHVYFFLLASFSNHQLLACYYYQSAATKAGNWGQCRRFPTEFPPLIACCDSGLSKQEKKPGEIQLESVSSQSMFNFILFNARRMYCKNSKDWCASQIVI